MSQYGLHCNWIQEVPYMSDTSVSIESVENLLPKELLELLQPFQIDQIKNMISSFLVMNFSVHEYVFEYCLSVANIILSWSKFESRNSLHSRIKAQYKRYRSVASKYINRYAALFRIQELYRKINGQEMITSLLMKLRHLHTTK